MKMLGDEKKERNLLLQFRVCRIYALTGASTKELSKLIDMPLSSVKRAIKVLDEEFDRCLELLPKAQIHALDAGLISELDLIDEMELMILRQQLIIEREQRKRYSKWKISETSLDIDEMLERYIEETRLLQEENENRLKKPSRGSSIVSGLRERGESIGELSKQYSLSKSTIKSILKRKGII